ADQAALAFENARLYASARDSLVRLGEKQVQLVQAAKMSALGQLVSGVAHELNNPLSVIVGYGQLLLAREVPTAVLRPIELTVSRDGRIVHAEVIDDGPGIPHDALSHVFEPFFSTKPVGSGTGLGLSVSYGIVEEHGGHLVVESRPGRTVFRLEMPVAQSAAAQRAAPAGSPMIVTGEGRVAPGAAHATSVLDLIVTILSQTGWRVDVATG